MKKSPSKIWGHSGDLGDIIACLPTIRALGGGHLVIFERHDKIPGTLNIRESMRGKRFDFIRPLLEAQPYIESVTWSDTIPKTKYDFSTFRHDHILGESLLEWQARHIGVSASTEPWLSGVTPRKDMEGRIVVTRTARYQNWVVPWPAIVKAHRERIVFIGLPAEHKDFQQLVGPVEYLPTATMLDVAEVIAGSDILIANQTAACWVGLGLGHPLIQEQSPVTRDSMIPRANAQYCLYDAMPVIPAAKSSSAIIIAPKPKPTMNPSASMLIVFPFFPGDSDRAKNLAEHIRNLGGVENHKCLIICPDGTSRDGIEEPLREAFASVDVHTYRATLEGWPQGPNEMFAEAAALIDRDDRFGDFFWMETDCSPRTSTWADQIAMEWKNGGLPMIGVTVDTVHMDSRQVVGRHVVGVAGYPKNFAQLCPLVRSVTQMSREYRMARQVPRAFDAYFGPYTVGRTTETRLIQHLWRSKGFEHGVDGIIRASEVTGPNAIVHPEAVLIHGAKDDSLLRIFSRRAPAAVIPPTESKQGISKAEKEAVSKIDEITKKSALQIVMPDSPKKEGVTYPPILKRGKRHVPMAPELWNRGEDGLPVPPFLPGQAEWIRYHQLLAGRYSDKGGFKKLRDYAKANLKINTLRMKAEQIVEACVLAERKLGTEEWTKSMPAPWFPPRVDPDEVPDLAPLPPVPVDDPSLHTHVDPSNPAGWSGAPPKSPDEITDAMRAKMLELRRKREAATATA